MGFNFFIYQGNSQILKERMINKENVFNITHNMARKKKAVEKFETTYGVNVSYDALENAITITPDSTNSNIFSTPKNYIFGAGESVEQLNDNNALLLFSRVELFNLAILFSPNIKDSLFIPETPYEDIEAKDASVFNTDEWNNFIYPHCGRTAISFNEITDRNLYFMCAAGYVDEFGNHPLKDENGNQVYRRVYFNGKEDQLPSIKVNSYIDSSSTVINYEKYQFIANSSINKTFNWPERRVRLIFSGLNFLVNASVNDNIKVRDNRDRNQQIIDLIQPEQYGLATNDPRLDMPVQLLVNESNPVDYLNAYEFANGSTVEERNYWGGELNFRVNPSIFGPISDTGDVSLFIEATRDNSVIGGEKVYEKLFVSNVSVNGSHFTSNEPYCGFTIKQLDQDVDIYISAERKNYTKKFIIMTDGNVITSDTTPINDYLNLYTKNEIQEMGNTDRIVTSYQNTIGFVTTNPELPRNLKIKIAPANAQEIDGIKTKLIGKYSDDNLSYSKYIEYMKNKANGSSTYEDYNWDSSHTDVSGIHATISHEYVCDHENSSYLESYIIYDISIDADALDRDPIDEKQCFYIAFDTIPRFNSHNIKLMVGYDPNIMKVRPNSNLPGDYFDTAGYVYDGDNGLWSREYTTKRDDYIEGKLTFDIDASKLAEDTLMSDRYSNLYISDTFITKTDYVQISP